MTPVQLFPYVMMLFCAVGIASIAYATYGVKLWGPERGLPFCQHPFWRANTSGGQEWTCPKCDHTFVQVFVEGSVPKWRPKR